MVATYVITRCWMVSILQRFRHFWKWHNRQAGMSHLNRGYAMCNVKVGIGLDALHKIQALASAAGFLTSSAEEEQLCLELIELIERSPVKLWRPTMDKPHVYRTEGDVLLNLQRSLDLMNCATRILGSGEEPADGVISLVDIAAHLTQQSTNALDLGEQTENEHGVCNG
jgi:hypothetical protein